MRTAMAWTMVVVAACSLEAPAGGAPAADASVAPPDLDEEVDASSEPQPMAGPAAIGEGSDGAVDRMARDADALLDAGSTPDAGGGEDASVYVVPTPATPCGSELDLRLGQSRPGVGALPAPTRFSGSPAAAGPFSVSTQSVSIPVRAAERTLAGQRITVLEGSLRGTAYVPSDPGPHPLLLVLPGFQASYSYYAAFSEHLASHGFCVVGFDTRSDVLAASHDKEALEVSQGLDFALSDRSPCAGKVDVSKVAVAGHSKGGKVAFYAAALDARIDLVIAWDPVNAGGGPCAFDTNCNALPVAPNCAGNASGVQHLIRAESLIIGAPPDALLNPDANHNADNFYRGAPSPASFVRLAAGHIDWVPPLANADVVRITKSVQLAVLLQRFRNVTGLEGWLPMGAELAREALLREARTK